MHSTPMPPKPNPQANAGRHNVSATVGRNKKEKNGVPKIQRECERVGDIALFDN